LTWRSRHCYLGCYARRRSAAHRALTRAYGSLLAVSDVDVSASAGRAMRSIIGPNARGKTTFSG